MANPGFKNAFNDPDLALPGRSQNGTEAAQAIRRVAY